MTGSPATGRFITFEGGEGAGKSVQLQRLATALRDRGHRVTVTREPGGTPEAEAIRALLVTGEPGRWTALSEALLFGAARADHLARLIRPKLAAGGWVLCDRFADSTRAYQGAAQGLDDAVIETLNGLVVNDTWPDLTLVIDVPVEVGLARAAGRGGAETRYEAFDVAFHERLRTAYLQLAAKNPGRCVIIDGAADEARVAQEIWQVVAARFVL